MNTIKKLFLATKYSIQGLSSAFKHELAFRLEILIAIFAIPAAVYFGDTAVKKALLIASILLVIIVELLNSAVEVIVDWISEEQHPLAGRAKDLGSAAVFIACMNVIIIWTCVLFF